MTYIHRVSDEVTQQVSHHLLIQQRLNIMIMIVYKHLKDTVTIVNDSYLRAMKPALFFHIRRDLMYRLNINVNGQQQFTAKHILSSLVDCINLNSKMIQELKHDYAKSLKSKYQHTRHFRIYTANIHHTKEKNLSCLQRRFKKNSTDLKEGKNFFLNKNLIKSTQ